MKYLVLLIGDGDEQPWPSLSPAEQGALMEKFGHFQAACEAREGVEILGGEALGAPDTFTVMRTRGGTSTFTEGPYAEGIEGLGGYYLVEAPDLDTLGEVLRSLPAYDLQIAPVMEMP